MATITTVSHGSYQNTPRRSYFTTSNYDGQFFGLYSNLNTTTYQTTYYLSNVQGASSAVCNSNAYLRETGKKIYPGQFQGIDSYYVSVFDDRTHLTGYINPNNALFLPLNTDKPLNILNELSTTGTSDDVNAGNYGPPVNTKGTINSVGYISTQSYVHANTFILADSYISSMSSINAGINVNAGSNLTAVSSITAGGNLSVNGYVSTGTYVQAGTYLAGNTVTVNPGAIDGGGNTTTVINYALANTIICSFSNAQTANRTEFIYFGAIGPPQIVPPKGTILTLFLINKSGQSQNITFNNTTSQLYSAANINVGGNAFGNNTVRTFTFTSDGTKLYCISRDTYVSE